MSHSQPRRVFERLYGTLRRSIADANHAIWLELAHFFYGGVAHRLRTGFNCLSLDMNVSITVGEKHEDFLEGFPGEQSHGGREDVPAPRAGLQSVHQHFMEGKVKDVSEVFYLQTMSNQVHNKHPHHT